MFAFHPHQDCFVVDAAAVVPLAGCDPRQATLLPMVETALQITLDAGAVLGETVVVFGLGVVGLLTAELLQRAGARVIAVDPLAWRRDVAACRPPPSLPTTSPRRWPTPGARTVCRS